ncbi:response regulator [Ammoniphilus sp. YIM 78166]|uniref:response regulator n=1 Tax=Ammoniphilus sp. YIM 78166 TaxID=1644106 RepID=UPI001430888C|nr:response regulator [Ammoniphilus sp. YIM 78166]
MRQRYDILPEENYTESQVYQWLLDCLSIAGQKGLDPLCAEVSTLLEQFQPNGTRTWLGRGVLNLLMPIYSIMENHIDTNTESERLLIVDDTPHFHSYLHRLLKDKDYTLVSSSSTSPNLLGNFYQANPCAVLLHARLGSLSCIEELKEKCKDDLIPMLVFQDQACSSDLAFADEVLLMSAEPGFLLSRIDKHLAKRRGIEELLLRDPVTAAFNNPYLKLEVNRQIQEMKRTHEPFCLVLVDINDLAGFNRCHGYSAGDGLMKGLVSFIQRSIRPMDTLARLHGDKFVLVLPKTYKEDAMKLMNRLLGNFREQEWKMSFCAKVMEYKDPKETLEECLAYLSLGKQEKKVAAVLDGSMEKQQSAMPKLRIAVIDDNRMQREFLKDQLGNMVLENYEIELRSYADGDEFFQDPWHRENCRYLLILDRIMPKMDGLEVLQKIRKEYDRRRYQVLMLSSKDQEGDITLAIQRGANDYMTKPFSLKELTVRMKRLVQGIR